MPSFLLAELSHQSCADRGDLLLILFPEEWAPASDGPAPDPIVFLHRMTVAEDEGRPAECGLHAGGVDAQAVYIFEVSLVSRPDVVSIQAVLDQQLPVGLDRISIGTRDDPHAFFGLIDDQVQILPSAREISHQLFDIGIEADKDKTAVTFYPRRRLEAHRRSIETVRVAGFVRHADEVALIVEAPGMIEALQNVGMPLVVPADQRASVCACVQKNPQFA